MKNSVEQIVLLAARPELQSTASIFDEINRHQAEIKAKEAELVKAQNDLKAREGKTEDAVEMMFTANEKLKVRLRGIEKENGSLLKTLEDRDKDLNERAEQISGLESDLKNLQASHSQEIKKAAQLCRDISSLQENIKEKEKIIDKMKAASSNLKTLLSDEQKKSAKLEKERRLLQADGQKTLEQLRKLESFVVRNREANEDLMYVAT
jgi:chromosome segregation ATPase